MGHSHESLALLIGRAGRAAVEGRGGRVAAWVRRRTSRLGRRRLEVSPDCYAELGQGRALEGNENPVEILLSIAADESNSLDTRVVAAAHSAPYMFPRLSSAVVTANVNVAKVDPAELIERLAERLTLTAARLVFLRGLAGGGPVHSGPGTPGGSPASLKSVRTPV